jgi:hypothetical protein
MDSLTTAYLVCMLLGSGCAVGGAVAGNKLFPIESSAITESLPVAEPTVSAAPQPQNTEQIPPATSSTTQ